jgi:tetratricopeptide (TPR) repeat protein
MQPAARRVTATMLLGYHQAEDLRIDTPACTNSFPSMPPAVFSMDQPLKDETVAVCGRIGSMTLAEFRDAVKELGGRYVTTVTHSTTIAVVGQGGLPLDKSGQPDERLAMAERFQAETGLQVLSEDDFLEMSGLVEAGSRLSRLYSLLDLTRLLSIPRDRIRRWVRAGLLQPAQTVHRLHFFRFHDVARLKTLDELRQAGVTQKNLADSIQKIAGWVDANADPLECLTNLTSAGRLVFRLSDGQPIESTGQMLFDFESETDGAAEQRILLAENLSSDKQLELAVEHESAGHYDKAMEIYDRLLKSGEDAPRVVFHLGNLYLSQKRYDDAIEQYKRALELDPDYVEALCNMGSALAELDHVDEAMLAYSRVLELYADFPDAHFNLADLLEQADRKLEARHHWQMYLRYDSRSEWADHAREQLATFGVVGEWTE